MADDMGAAGRDELVFLPLGGVGEIGMNCYLYGLGPADDRQWLRAICAGSGGIRSGPRPIATIQWSERSARHLVRRKVKRRTRVRRRIKRRAYSNLPSF